MPFLPNPVPFHAVDRDKSVTFASKIESPKPWNVVGVTLSLPTRLISLNALRWTFPDSLIVEDTVDLDLMRATLRYDPLAPASPVADKALATLWPKVAGVILTLTLDIRCGTTNTIPQSLSVQLLA